MGSDMWARLNYLKEYYPVDVSELAKARLIGDETKFPFWVPYIMMKYYTIILSTKTRIRKIAHKYGIEIPTSVEHTYKIDENNNNFSG